MSKLIKIYETRAVQFEQTAQQLKAKYLKYSLVRLVTFIISVGIAIYLTATFAWWLGLLMLIIFLPAFAKFIHWHLDIQQQQRHHEYLVKVNQNEIAALQNDISNFEAGEEFVDAQHSYTVDLDIFGAFSFFQFSNRTSTTIGKHRLAKYLETIPDLKEIKKRQEAIAELHQQLDWRQHFQAIGMATEDDLQHIKLLHRWLGTPPFILKTPWLRFAIIAAPFWMVLSFVVFLLWLPWQVAIFLLLPPGWILKKTIEQVNEAHFQTTHAEKILAFYAKLIAHIETHDFSSEKLSSLKTAFFKNSKTASTQINKLSYIIRQLNIRYNPFAILLNISVLWDLRYVLKLEKWKAEMKECLPDWFEALAEFEAISSLATVYYNNPDWQFPSIQDKPTLEAITLGHPLIASSVRICNDVQIPTNGHIKLVTGSNMAGKSTFLRTIGLNIVLAMSGAPVCAKRMTLPLLQVYTSMRTQDALHESTSSFYAELKRLKFIIEAVKRQDNIFFLLDEILKGTNSNDRHTGSQALIRQLIKSGGSGIIATHDLELGQLEAISNGAIENLCMEVEIKNSELFFDYKLKKGVSKSFNATLLMQNMGIEI